MRIVFVTPYYYPEHKFGGPPRKIHALARGLSNCGHDIRVITFHSELPAGMAEMPVNGIAVEYLPWVGGRLTQFPRSGLLIGEAVQFADLTHCYGIYNVLCPVAIRAARRAGKPAILEPLGMYPARTGNWAAKFLYNATLTRSMVRSVSALVAASEAEARDLQELAPGKEVIHRRNGVDLERFASLPRHDHLRIRWAIKPSERVILYVGRLSPIKNLKQMITAFAKANLASPNGRTCRLVLVGPSDARYQERLRAVVARERIAERVTFAGPLYDDDQKAALGLAELFVLPSLNESFGNAAAEAVAAGVPVLLTNTCGIAPLIHERAGLAVPLGIDSLADGLQKMLLHSGFRDRMMVRREEVKRELSWDEPIKQTIALYQQVIGESAERLKSKTKRPD